MELEVLETLVLLLVLDVEVELVLLEVELTDELVLEKLVLVEEVEVDKEVELMELLVLLVLALVELVEKVLAEVEEVEVVVGLADGSRAALLIVQLSSAPTLSHCIVCAPAPTCLSDWPPEPIAPVMLAR